MLTRSALLGLASFCAMLDRRCEARGEMDIPSGAPESSVRGCRTARAGVAAEGSVVVASVRRESCGMEATRKLLLKVDACVEALGSADGARKSRWSCDVAAVRLYALAALCVVLAGLALYVAALRTARRHDEHMVDGEAMDVVVLTRAQMADGEWLRSCSTRRPRHSQLALSPDQAASSFQTVERPRFEPHGARSKHPIRQHHELFSEQFPRIFWSRAGGFCAFPLFSSTGCCCTHLLSPV